jgi:hypothetical protein
MPAFEATVSYLGHDLTIRADDFADLHQILAGIHELKRDERYLREQTGQDVIPVYREDQEGNKYYGLQEAEGRRNITYGQKRGDSHLVPFFPKEEDGYYEPSPVPAPSTNGRGDHASSERDPRAGSKAQAPHSQTAARKESIPADREAPGSILSGQQLAIQTLAKRFGWTQGKLCDEVQAKTGRPDVESLSYNQARNVIMWLQAKPKQPA